MLEIWLENRLLPMAPIRYASCSLTTLGMLTESSRNDMGESEKKSSQILVTCSQFPRIHDSEVFKFHSCQRTHMYFHLCLSSSSVVIKCLQGVGLFWEALPRKWLVREEV